MSTDDDLTQMYSEHHGRKSINLWLKLKSIKHRRPNDPSTECAAPQAKRSKSCESHLEKMDELQKIVDTLKDKHKEGKYSHLSSAQFHCWGNTIQLGHHDSYDHPPNKPFFGATKTASIGGGASPGKRIHLRSECIDQLTKWHKLKSDGVITMEEYQDMHKTILGDIKKFRVMRKQLQLDNDYSYPYPECVIQLLHCDCVTHSNNADFKISLGSLLH